MNKVEYYDPVTDRIHNAIPNTEIYFHELRHQQQHRGSAFVRFMNLKYNLLLIYANSFLLFNLILSGLLSNQALAIFFLTLFVFMNALKTLTFWYLEIDAVLYAKKKIKEKKKLFN